MWFFRFSFFDWILCLWVIADCAVLLVEWIGVEVLVPTFIYL